MRRSTAAALLGIGALTAALLFATRPLTPVGLGLIAAGLGARGWAEYARRRARVIRTVPLGRPVEGSTVRIVYRIEGVPSLALGPCLARERVDGVGALEARLAGGEGALELRSAPRGRFAVEAAEVVLEDHLGLERVLASPQAVHPLLVYPRIPELAGLFTDTTRQHGGYRAVPLRAAGFDFHSVREYEHGESMRRVHWPTTARLGRLMVKDLREAPHDDAVVVLQREPTAVAGPRGDSSFDVEVRAAGGLVRALVARGRRVALVLGTRRSERFRVTSLDSDWDAALAALAAVEADGDLPLEHVLDDEAVKRAGELVLVAAALRPGVVDRLLMLGGRRAAAVLVDTASFGSGAARTPDPGPLRLAAAGVPVAVVRRGDALADVLGGPAPRRVSA